MKNIFKFKNKALSAGGFHVPNGTLNDKKRLMRTPLNDKAYGSEEDIVCGLHGAKAPLSDKGECGRSMVEMLGVLAVIGVLSATAIYGYKQAMTQHKANQVWQDLLLRVQVIRGIHDYSVGHLREKNKPVDFSDLGAVGESGYLITGELHAPDYYKSIVGAFSLTVHDVPTDVCQKIVQMRPDMMVAISPNKRQDANYYGPNSAECDATDNKNDMSFYFDSPSLCAGCDEWYNIWMNGYASGWVKFKYELGAVCHPDIAENSECPSGFQVRCSMRAYGTHWGTFYNIQTACLPE